MRTNVYAHRGASGYEPENTMEAFELAKKMGADGIELDIQLTKDEEVIVLHDYTIDRTSDGKGFVKDYTLKELKEFNFNRGMNNGIYRIPLLSDVLDLIKNSNMTLNIELKCDSMFPYEKMLSKTIDMVRDFKVEDQILYSSFDHYALRKLKFLNMGAKTGILYDACLYEPWKYAKTIGATRLHPLFTSLYEPYIIDLAHREGMEINTWTVNDMDICRQLVIKGVDGVITNYPDKAKTICDELELKE